MINFSQAIVRTPGRSLVSGLSGTPGAKPVYEKALEQHQAYSEALQQCGLNVTCLPCLEEYPDSVFVEDAAVVFKDLAIVTAPGAPSRAGEVDAISSLLTELFPRITQISAPGKLDGGDVMMTEGCCYVGMSQRTNKNGAEQLFKALVDYGFAGEVVPVSGLLHLKTGITWLGEDQFIATGIHLQQEQFQGYKLLEVSAEQAGAANCIAINDKILMAAGFANVRRQLETLGREIIEVDISEFAKIDGGLTCLSLRF